MLYQRGCHLDPKRFPDRASSLVQNQAEKRAFVVAGRAHGIIVYDDSEPIGWCQFGPADELPLPGYVSGRQQRYLVRIAKYTFPVTRLK